MTDTLELMVDGNIMNERIKELALHSKLRPALLLHHWGKIDALTDSEQEELEQLEKFAELIVLDFIEIVASSDPNRNLPKKRPTTKILGEPYESIITRIEEHFGVDE
jgi:hypothetical protein